MVVFSVHLGDVCAHLSFVSYNAAKKAMEVYMAAKKDDPEGELELKDDYDEIFVFKPGAVKIAFIIDKEREQEIQVQQALQDVRTKIAQQQRVQGDSKIVAAAKSIPSNVLAQPPGGSA